MKHQKRSFTLVEILVAAAMICLLAAVILIAYNGIYRKWATVNTVAAMKSAHLVLDRFALENNQYPVGKNTLGEIAKNSDSAKFIKELFQECSPYAHKYEDGYVAVFDDFGTKPSADDAEPVAGMQEIFYVYPYNDTNTFVLFSKGKDGEWAGDDDIIYLPFGLSGVKPGFYYGNVNNYTAYGELEPIAQ